MIKINIIYHRITALIIVMLSALGCSLQNTTHDLSNAQRKQEDSCVKVEGTVSNLVFDGRDSVPRLTYEQLTKEFQIEIEDSIFSDWYYLGYCYIIGYNRNAGMGEVTIEDCPLYIFERTKDKWLLKEEKSFYRNAELLEGSKNLVKVEIFKAHDNIDDGIVGFYQLTEGNIKPVHEYSIYCCNNKESIDSDTISCFYNILTIKTQPKFSYQLIKEWVLYSEIKDSVGWDWNLPTFLNMNKYGHRDTILVEFSGQL